MRGVGNYHLVARGAALAMVRAHHQQSGKLALRAGRRMERHGVHPGYLGERRLQPRHQFERARGQMRRGHRMQRGKAGERRHLVVEHGIVLHRARAERIELERLPEVELREAQKMAHHLRLAEFRKPGDVVAAKLRA